MATDWEVVVPASTLEFVIRSRQRVGVTGSVNETREQMSCHPDVGATVGAPNESVERRVFAGDAPET